MNGRDVRAEKSIFDTAASDPWNASQQSESLSKDEMSNTAVSDKHTIATHQAGVDSTFSMCDPHSQSGALHAFEPDGRRGLYPHTDEAGLKPARLIMGQDHFRLWRRCQQNSKAY